MSNTNEINFRQILTILNQYRWLWITPTVLMTFLAAGYGLLTSKQWQASQAVWIRDEVAGSGRAGDFDNPEARQSALETLHELAKNHKVIADSLRTVGPEPGKDRGPEWPDSETIEGARQSVSIVAPKGTEFGRTEFVYLTVKHVDKQRALALSEAITSQMDKRLQELRQAKAQSLITELENSLQLAQANRDGATSRLEAIEREVGSDLGELRILNDSGAGDSNLRAALNQIKDELRQAQQAQLASKEQQQHLEAAVGDPALLLATPNRILETQPALRKLKEGLTDSKLRTAELLGLMSREHPRVKAALAAEIEVKRDLTAELAIALRGVAAELKVSERLVRSLREQSEQVRKRLDRLAGMRARYANVVSEVQHHTQIVEQNQRELGAARARQSAAMSSSLLTLLDAPRVGSAPLGPGLKSIVVAGFAGGLLTGFGLVFLIAPWGGERQRRWTDYLGVGRRASDTAGGRRNNDTTSVVPRQRQQVGKRRDDRATTAATQAERRATAATIATPLSRSTQPTATLAKATPAKATPAKPAKSPDRVKASRASSSDAASHLSLTESLRRLNRETNSLH